MNILIIKKSANDAGLSFTAHKMIIELEDGRELSVPLEWFPKLRNASAEELNNWRFIGGGEGIHWQALDDDISVGNLLE
ncbi:MAG: DUF2442 domain-containing protein [Bacteroidia bacterium]